MTINVEITGCIEVMYPIEEKKSFIGRNIVVNVPHMSMNAQYITIQFISTLVKELEDFSVGDRVTIIAMLKGRKWIPPGSDDTKYFNTIRAYSIKLIN